ncbi:hypothetical protein EVAR_84786_1 [Eumeta japonica]|uniref:Uncharacterized protein n=1 Tax=Eumeta variegata TaxID=151549 RepID=A0A4C1U8A6_EUMVA|nr:hypothetical protein EVAR_84786_1 [Eumeta japonica]
MYRWRGCVSARRRGANGSIDSFAKRKWVNNARRRGRLTRRRCVRAHDTIVSAFGEIVRPCGARSTHSSLSTMRTPPAPPPAPAPVRNWEPNRRPIVYCPNACTSLVTNSFVSRYEAKDESLERATAPINHRAYGNRPRRRVAAGIQLRDIMLFIG